MKNKSEAPLMYKGWWIWKSVNGHYEGQNFGTGQHLNPIYKTWDALKLIIDSLKK